MTITKDLMMAILSMDAYMRGYNEQVDVDDKQQVGAATVLESVTLGDVDSRTGENFSVLDFSASVYSINPSEIDGLDSGHVVAFRGTDNYNGLFNFESELLVRDRQIFLNGDGTVRQLYLASNYLRDQENQYGRDIYLTGHSLGGVLAGFTGAIRDLDATLVDNIGFYRALEDMLATVESVRDWLDFETAEAATQAYINNLISGPGGEQSIVLRLP